MTVYRQLQRNIEEAVGRINGRFSRVGWTPVQFFARALPFHEVVAYYAMADLMWITPLRDGLNLVCKEYVATQGLSGGRGVRSDERRVGKGWVSTCRSRGAP